MSHEDAKEKAAEFMVAALNATMFQEVRELISTMTDPNAKCPGRHLEAQRILPALDAFLGRGYTGRVIALNRMIKSMNVVECATTDPKPEIGGPK
jgi:hypothetical protein